jgi:hypothetical protein
MRKTSSEVRDLAEDEVIRELIRLSDQESSKGDCKRYSLLLEKRFKEVFIETIETAAKHAHSYYIGSEGVKSQEAYGIVLSHLYGDSRETSWATLRKYTPGNAKGWIYTVSKRRLRYEALSSTHDREEALPDEELRRLSSDGYTDLPETTEADPVDLSIAFRRAVAVTAALLPEDQKRDIGRFDPEFDDPESLYDVARRLIRAVVKNERDRLGEGQSGTPYADVLLNVHLQSGRRTTDLYDVFYEELQEQLPEDQVPARGTLTNWAMRGRDNLQSILESEYPCSVQTLADIFL